MTAASSAPLASLGVPGWLCDALAAKPFGFTTSLPVQTAVLPFSLKAFDSWLLQCDVCLSSPTGSGKTLCYALPMLAAIAAQRQRFPSGGAAHAGGGGGGGGSHLRGIVVVPTAILAEQVTEVLQALSTAAGVVVGTLFRGSDDGSNLTRAAPVAGDGGAAARTAAAARKGGRCAVVDILVATPQKLCAWIERLADDDDNVAATGAAAAGGGAVSRPQPSGSAVGANTTAASGAISAAATAASATTSTTASVVDVFGRVQCIVLDEADDLLSTSVFTSMAGRIVESVQDAVVRVGEAVLHKMLCSATLTSRISKVSDVRLQNAKYFSLDADGGLVGAADAVGALTTTTTTRATALSRQQQRAGRSAASAGLDIVRPLFPLPSSLVEHLVIVRDDAKRHVTLLATVRHALAALQQQRSAEAAAAAAAAAAVTGAGGDSADAAALPPVVAAAAPSSSSAWTRCGSSVIVFCQTAEIARVMGHFLAVAGIDALELTTLTSDTERRQAALAVATAAASAQKVVVVSDALMRGIDMPGVGAVVMYDPPTTLQQYIHRVGRTARAGARGASYVLLSKLGPSGTEDDGQVAHFKSFDAMLLRRGKVSNQVKLRELPEHEVAAADRMLEKTQQRLHATGWATTVAAGAATAATTAGARRTRA